MCQASIHMPTRKAKANETVYAVTDHHGAFTTRPNMPVGAGNLVCIPYDTKCTLPNLKLRTGLWAPGIAKYNIGKTIVAFLVRSARHQRNGDQFKLPDGTMLPSYLVVSPIVIGVVHKLFRGRKQFDAHLEKWPPSKKGVAVIKAAIAEAVRLPVVRVRDPHGRFIKA